MNKQTSFPSSLKSILGINVMVVISSWTASISLASLVKYWQRRSSCCRAMAMRRDRLCMQLMTDGSAFACTGNDENRKRLFTPGVSN
uniref:Uncharacterized protein n=1 Tax=Gouania willdenowi TaxID=441366 RepID=A0A8C5EGH9_GOUWI